MKNPVKDKKSRYRVVRGGYWNDCPFDMRASFRDYGHPTSRSNTLGFRLVKNIPKRRNEESSKK